MCRRPAHGSRGPPARRRGDRPHRTRPGLGGEDPDAQLRDVVAFVRQHALVAPELPVPAVEVRDPTDLPILAAVIQGAAEVLVTGDKDLLVLGRVEALPILDPRGFWGLLKG